MGTIGAGIMDYVNAAKQKLGFGPKPVETIVEQAVPNLPKGTDMGMAAEPAGMTSGGGRRLSKMRKGKKTRKGGRRGGKTHRKH